MNENVEIRRSQVIKDLICHVREFEVLQSKNNVEVIKSFKVSDVIIFAC